MQIKIINCMGAETIVFLDNIYWLGKTQTCVTWRAGVVNPFVWFTDINNPTLEELTLFELEFGKEVLDFVFSSNKKLEIMSL